MPHTLDAPVVRVWCRTALHSLGRAREEIDAINVYPVADGDTGTNLYLTLESAVQSLDAVFDGHAASGGRPDLAEAVRALAHGALIGARGNSGTILAQLLRGMSEVLADRADAEGLRQALRRAASSAYQAVAHPVEGTMLTVAAAAADAVAAAGTLAAVATAAYDGGTHRARRHPRATRRAGPGRSGGRRRPRARRGARRARRGGVRPGTGHPARGTPSGAHRAPGTGRLR